VTGELDVVLTRISADGIWYRGHDVITLAREHSVEEVASLLWTGAFDTDIFDTPLHVISGAGGSGLPFLSRAQSILPLVAASDPLAGDLRPHAVAGTGWRILNLLASVAADSQDLEETLEETLARAWTRRPTEAAPLIRAVLIVCADFGTDAATRTARCVAASRANPYAVSTASLAAMTGNPYSDELAGAASPFAGGDPRAALLLAMLAATEATPPRPSLEDALVSIGRAFAFPDDAPATMFAIGRIIGCIAHAIDEYKALSS
jgi:citrate synthase